MKNLVIAVLSGLMIFFVSCEEEDLSMERVPSSEVGRSQVFTINSRENKGFSVDALKLADFPKTDADFIIIPQTNLTGDIMSPFLSNPDLEKRFFLSDEFEDSKSAQSYFESYDVNPESEDLQQFALNLKSNQVWLVKTLSGTFCKIWILETKIDKSTSFVEIKFRAQKLV
ncbi:MAG TPA: hypothetical protein VHI78_09900 [Bacteroidales bacterium]|jgi:hypothetical protein|nr:hypothetical protein [Bacteroidales bacterium]